MRRRRKICTGIIYIMIFLAVLNLIFSMIRLHELGSNETGIEGFGNRLDYYESYTPVKKQSDWKLVLVNTWNEIPKAYEVALTELRNEQAVDERIYPDLQDMMDAMRAIGLEPLICSSYRTYEMQAELHADKVNDYLAQGYSIQIAQEEAKKWVASPGTSEHQLGLAVDIVDISYQLLDENQEHTKVQQWLMRNSYKYGFVLRYPEGKSDITGIYYEPWHYRYVGKQAAKEIYEKGLCLEEYLKDVD